MGHKMLKIIIAVLLLLFSCIVSGCGQDVSQEEYAELLAENQRLSLELEESTATVDAKLTGWFVATVHYLIPDFCLDSTTPLVAIMTSYQGGPFVLEVGEEMAAQLEEGSTYYFQLKDTPIGKIPKKEFEQGWYAIESKTRPVHIESFRAPKEGEGGVNSMNIIYELAN